MFTANRGKHSASNKAIRRKCRLNSAGADGWSRRMALAPPPSAPPPPLAAINTPRLPFSAFLGLRYLKPRRTFVSVITIISVLGVIFGVAVPIIVLSVMKGFDRELHDKVLGFDAHIEITRVGGLLDNWRQVRRRAATVKPEGDAPGVVGTAPYVRGPVLVEANHQRVGAVLRGIEPKLEQEVTDTAALMRTGPGRHAAGQFDLDGDNVVVGYALADLLRVHVGDKLTVISSHGLEKLGTELENLKGKGADDKKITELREIVAPAELTVTGIFDSGRYQYDSQFVFVPLHIGEELYDLEGAVHGIAVKTNAPYRAEEVKARLFAQLGDESLGVKTWIDLNAYFFDAVRTERTTMFVILFFILIVAAFSVMNTLITVTVQKTREIGIMKAVGADVSQIVRVFLTQGVVTGFFGTLGGLAVALGVLRLLNPFKAWMEWQFGVVVFSKEVYGFGQIPYWTRWRSCA